MGNTTLIGISTVTYRYYAQTGENMSKKGYWGKFHRVNGEMIIVYIGPMTEEEMAEDDDNCAYRHNFSEDKPPNTVEITDDEGSTRSVHYW